MNAIPPTTGQARLVLSALADRLVYGDEETFDPADARELLALMPPLPGWRRWLSGWMPQMQAKVEMPGSSSAGMAAGVGNVAIGGERLKFDLDSRGRRVVRAGQWKLSWAGQSVQIEQVMADDADDGRTALVRFDRGEPVRMELLAVKDITVGVVTFSRAVFHPWKTPRHRSHVDSTRIELVLFLFWLYFPAMQPNPHTETVPFDEVAAILDEAAIRAGGGPPALIVASGRHLAGALEAAGCRVVRDAAPSAQLRLAL